MHPMTRARPAVGSLVRLDANILYPIRLCDFFLTAGVVGRQPGTRQH